MFSLNENNHYYLCTSGIDMREGFNTLSGVVTNNSQFRPVDGSVYVFVNKNWRGCDKGRESIAGDSLLSEIIISKYVDHLPVYRQLEIFKRLGVKLSDAIVCGWIQQTANQLQRECYSSGGIRKEELLVLWQPRHGTRHCVKLFFTEQLQASGHQSCRMAGGYISPHKRLQSLRVKHSPPRKLETQTDSR